MKIKSILFTAVGAVALSGVSAMAEAGGGKMMVAEPAPGPAPIAEPQLFGANVSVGYDSHYMFRGVNYGENSVWTSVEWTLPCTPDCFDFTIGAWYENPIDGVPTNPLGGDELDLYATISMEVAPGISVWGGYLAYLYPDDSSISSTNEVATGVDASILNGMLDLQAAGAYDIDVEGWYFLAGASHTCPLTDCVSITVGSTIGYQIDYNNFGDDWNDVRAYAELPIALTDNAYLTPYISHSWSLGAIDSYQPDELYGGVSLSVDF